MFELILSDRLIREAFSTIWPQIAILKQEEIHFEYDFVRLHLFDTRAWHNCISNCNAKKLNVNNCCFYICLHLMIFLMCCFFWLWCSNSMQLFQLFHEAGWLCIVPLLQPYCQIRIHTEHFLVLLLLVCMSFYFKENPMIKSHKINW